jgi:hypothetical protein
MNAAKGVASGNTLCVPDKFAAAEKLRPMDRLTRLKILADVAREIPKNFAMMVPAVRAWRMRSPRPTRRFAEVT